MRAPVPATKVTSEADANPWTNNLAAAAGKTERDELGDVQAAWATITSARPKFSIDQVADEEVGDDEADDFGEFADSHTLDEGASLLSNSGCVSDALVVDRFLREEGAKDGSPGESATTSRRSISVNADPVRR